MIMDLTLVPATFADHAAINIWHARFANEYNAAHAARRGRRVHEHIPAQYWRECIDSGFKTLWIKQGGRCIGFVTVNQLTQAYADLGIKNTYEYVCDAYIDKKHRGRGVLTAVLQQLQSQGVDMLMIDSHILSFNLAYYKALGYRWLTEWQDRDYMLISRIPVLNWIDMNDIPSYRALAA
jgi:GNAT superfamily N-acetyltransferase